MAMSCVLVCYNNLSEKFSDLYLFQNNTLIEYVLIDGYIHKCFFNFFDRAYNETLVSVGSFVVYRARHNESNIPDGVPSDFVIDDFGLRLDMTAGIC